MTNAERQSIKVMKYVARTLESGYVLLRADFQQACNEVGVPDNIAARVAGSIGTGKFYEVTGIRVGTGRLSVGGTSSKKYYYDRSFNLQRDTDLRDRVRELDPIL